MKTLCMHACVSTKILPSFCTLHPATSSVQLYMQIHHSLVRLSLPPRANFSIRMWRQRAEKKCQFLTSSEWEMAVWKRISCCICFTCWLLSYGQIQGIITNPLGGYSQYTFLIVQKNYVQNRKMLQLPFENNFKARCSTKWNLNNSNRWPDNKR